MDITTLDPLPVEIQSLILDHLKDLVPLKLCTVSKSLHRDVSPLIYSSLKITEENASRVFYGFKDIASSHFKVIRPRYRSRKGGALHHVKEMRFGDMKGLLAFVKACTDVGAPCVGAYSWYDPLDG
ncbi:hypothetical protein IAR55_005524 [Kwoniella newhampshirensis]|uniref:F-box domain-containing protein n=1 Tax=Kwoniella newhampshirensis TaxID=1651941 RepID=A0AAW0YHR2_9TREE